jgi:glycosyltransferase involved in cell wall biosynthesis
MSGAWIYTRELVTGLVTRGVRVTLVSFGEIPLPEETAWMELLHGLEYRPTAFRLEWMDEAPHDVPESARFLASLVSEVQPDLLHLHQFCHANLAVDVPRVVMAHGDVISWTQAVQGHSPRQTRWLKWYRDNIVRGISAADAVIAPSAWMLDTIRSTYTHPRREVVIYPGRNPIFFNPYVSKDDSVLSVGRLLDAGKQVFLLTQHAQPFSVCIVGAEQTVPQPRIPIRADVKVSTEQSCVAIRGPQTEAQLRSLYSRAAVYAATARYEPLGMGALDAAFSRCAIVANDIPSYREVWGDAALYFRTNDAGSLAEILRQLDADRALRRAFADRAYARARERFTTKRMIDDYLDLYRSLIAAASLAA